jgi:hypothetical protein
MAKENAMAESIIPMQKHCSAMRVTIKAIRKRDKYYLEFDGSKSYPNPETWKGTWVSFEIYVVYILGKYGYKTDSIEMKNSTYAVCSVGTLFDFLAK